MVQFFVISCLKNHFSFLSVSAHEHLFVSVVKRGSPNAEKSAQLVVEEKTLVDPLKQFHAPSNTCFSLILGKLSTPGFVKATLCICRWLQSAATASEALEMCCQIRSGTFPSFLGNKSFTPSLWKIRHRCGLTWVMLPKFWAKILLDLLFRQSRKCSSCLSGAISAVATAVHARNHTIVLLLFRSESPWV